MNAVSVSISLFVAPIIASVFWLRKPRQSAPGKPKLVAFAGGTCSGKTSTIKSLGGKGYKTLPEVAFLVFTAVKALMPNPDVDVWEWRGKYPEALNDLIAYKQEAEEQAVHCLQKVNKEEFGNLACRIFGNFSDFEGRFGGTEHPFHYCG